MVIVEVSLNIANDFVRLHHRHNQSVPGHRFSLAAYSQGQIVGVAIVGNPIARLWAQLGWRWEVRRTCTNGYRNANSALYAACRRETYRRGIMSLITYTRYDEPGTSLIAAGWYPVGSRKRADTWNCKARERGLNGGEHIGKITWEAW